MSLVPGFNLEGIIETDLIDVNIKESLDMREERPKKKKVKFNFDHLFPRPKGTEKDMGMGDICDGKPFEGLL